MTINNQSLIQCLDAIKDNVTRGENKAALLNLAKLELCLAVNGCLDNRPVKVETASDCPAILREQAI